MLPIKNQKYHKPQILLGILVSDVKIGLIQVKYYDASSTLPPQLFMCQVIEVN
jgi:hypothetical protein